ncbi:hypothetical protein J6TS7_11980 [Paenibacillus dendritiformis]|nr:hypothetical protein J6TS7_11980 [Paenibacillus dendritiformis]
MPAARLQHIAHHHLLRRFREQPGALQRFPNEQRSQLDRRHFAQSAHERADRRPYGACNHDVRQTVTPIPLCKIIKDAVQ